MSVLNPAIASKKTVDKRLQRCVHVVDASAKRRGALVGDHERSTDREHNGCDAPDWARLHHEIQSVFPPVRGGYVDLHNFRAREWIPAVKAARFVDENKKATRRIYDLRHTYATISLAAGVSLFSLSRRMGTSLDMIDRTYGHLVPDAEIVELALLNEYDARERSTAIQKSRN